MIPIVFRHIVRRARALARAAALALAVVAAGGCATVDRYMPIVALVRRLQDRHQPGQLPLAGHGRQAEGRQTPAAGASSVLGTPLVTVAVPRQTAGTTSTSSRGRGARRAPQVHRVLRRRQAHALGRRRDAGVGRRAQPRRASAQGVAGSTAPDDKGVLGPLPRHVPASSAESRRTRDDDRCASPSPAPAAAWARR